jgi:maltose O-acetyltransferase
LTEKEKMLAGMLYDASDPLLVQERERARHLTRLYNHSQETEHARRQSLLETLLGTVTGDLTIEPPFYCDYGSHIHCGAGVFLNFGCVILDVNPIYLGNYTKIGPGVHIYAAHHPLSPEQRRTGLELGSPVRLGDNVWIGGGVYIMPGITIGSDTVVGSGSVVTKSLPTRVLAAGNPCRIIRELP